MPLRQPRSLLRAVVPRAADQDQNDVPCPAPADAMAKKGRSLLGAPLSVSLAAAAVVALVAAVAAAIAAAVAEQEQQDDDPPPVVAAEPIADIVIAAHKITSETRDY